MKTIPLMFLLCTGLAAQDPGSSEAEQRFHSAWWQEAAHGELQQALQGYLQAATLDGPTAIRARALLRAAEIQHRLEQGAAATATLSRLLTQFADQREVVAEATSRQSEWQEIDLRENYAEWYRQRLFSPEEQTKILELVRKLGGLSARQEDQKELEAVQGQLLAYEQAAVPALEQLATSSNYTLAYRATTLILQIGAIPPAQALINHTGWAQDERSWRPLLTIAVNAHERRDILAVCRGRVDVFASFLAAAARSNTELVDLLGSEAGGMLAVEYENVARALIEALHEIQDEKLHDKLVRLGDQPRTPIAVRREIEYVVMEAEYGWRGANAAEWFDWGQRCLSWNGTCRAVEHASRLLRANDGETLDAILELFATAPEEGRYEVGNSMRNGLVRNGVPLQLPWTPERVHRLLMLPVSEYEFAQVFDPHRLMPEGRKLLVEACLLDPAALVNRYGDDYSGVIAATLMGYLDEVETVLVERAWGREVSEQMIAAWEQWPSEQRSAALKLITEHGLLSVDQPFPSSLLKFLKARSESGPDTEIFVTAWPEIAEHWNL